MKRNTASVRPPARPPSADDIAHTHTQLKQTPMCAPLSPLPPPLTPVANRYTCSSSSTHGMRGKHPFDDVRWWWWCTQLGGVR